MDAVTTSNWTETRKMSRYVAVAAVFCVFLATGVNGESKINIISRAEWGARPPKSRVNLTSPVPYVIIHHSYEPDVCLNRTQCEKSVRAIQNFHMDTRGWNDIGYNFLVGGNGDVFEGRGWDVVGVHAGTEWNYKSLGICFIGDFTNKLPPEKATQAGKRLIRLCVEKNKLTSNYTLYGHRQVIGPTPCPGQEFYERVTEWKHWKPKNYTEE